MTKKTTEQESEDLKARWATANVEYGETWPDGTQTISGDSSFDKLWRDTHRHFLKAAREEFKRPQHDEIITALLNLNHAFDRLDYPRPTGLVVDAKVRKLMSKHSYEPEVKLMGLVITETPPQ